MKNFNFGKNKVFILGGEDDGGIVLEHNVQISPNDFKHLMAGILSDDEINQILYNCKLEDLISLARKINSIYGVYSETRDIFKVFLENDFFDYLDILCEFSEIEEVSLAIKNIENVWNNPRSEGILKPEKRNSLGYIYLLKSGDLYKIGKAKDLEKRMKPFSVSFPAEWSLEHYFKSNDYNKAELLLHKEFENKRKVGEWFKLGLDDVSTICSIKDFEL